MYVLEKQYQAITGKNDAKIGCKNLKIAISKVQRSPTTAVLIAHKVINKEGTLPSIGFFTSRVIAMITSSSDMIKGSGIAIIKIPFRYESLRYYAPYPFIF
ncbi:hypothetical protein [Moritella sp.]|uniref:hypothetical protein n=1 Tax=Moritella sp. TaxID=78556 RepID=UPI0025FE7D12|nr:hypothetical protein [Moritella sp.]MCJ8348970.1 hypothetical protein [Moritella sp.]